jgi:hypothetical protein
MLGQELFMRLRHLIFFVALATTVGCSGLAPGQSTVKVQQQIPELALVDQHNQPVSVRALATKGTVLVVFYRGHF